MRVRPAAPVATLIPPEPLRGVPADALKQAGVAPIAFRAS
jgi:hypothetical protein